MRAFIFTAALALLQVKGISQDSTYNKLLKDAIHSLRDNPTIYYIDSSINFYGIFSRFVRKKIVTGYTDLKSDKQVTMSFTRAELREIDQEIQGQSRNIWPDNFIRNSVRLAYDSIENFVNVNNRPVNPGQRNYKYYYLFSQPVFTRNNTIAIFRIAEMIDHSAGFDFVIIYIKENEKWNHKLTIRAGAW